jgi:hypothetical protein
MYIIGDPKEEQRPEDAKPDIDLDEGELSLIKCKHYGTADKFNNALWELIWIADADDLAKLEQVYPKHIAAYINYKRVPGWFEELVSRMPQRRTSDAT